MFLLLLLRLLLMLLLLSSGSLQRVFRAESLSTFGFSLAVLG